MIVSFAGAFLREIGGWIAVSDLIRLMGEVGIGEPAVRQALVRLKGRRFLEAQRRDGVAGYALTDEALRDLRIGDRRIFRYGEAAVEDGWVLAVFSVPESERQHRHQLRSQLARLGFGTVAPGVWIAPGPLADPAREEIGEAGLGEYVTWFTGEQSGPGQPSDWWDLPALAAMYTEFLGRFAGRLDGDRPGTGFAGYLLILDAWRQFPRLDPGLPATLLPADWPGRTAWQLFDRAHSHRYGPALEHVRSETASR